MVQIKKPPEPDSHSYQGEEATQSWGKRRHRLPVNLSLTDYYARFSSTSCLVISLSPWRMVRVIAPGVASRRLSSSLK